MFSCGGEADSPNRDFHARMSALTPLRSRPVMCTQPHMSLATCWRSSLVSNSRNVVPLYLQKQQQQPIQLSSKGTQCFPMLRQHAHVRDPGQSINHHLPLQPLRHNCTTHPPARCECCACSTAQATTSHTNLRCTKQMDESTSDSHLGGIIFRTCQDPTPLVVRAPAKTNNHTPNTHEGAPSL